MFAIIVLLIIDLMSQDVDVPLWGYLILILAAFVWNVCLESVN